MIFLNSASSAAALVFYLPALCTQTDTEGKQSSEYFEKFGKKTQYLMKFTHKKIKEKRSILQIGNDLYAYFIK